MGNGIFAIKDAGSIVFQNKVTKSPYLYVDYANSFSLSSSTETVYARAKGANRVAFSQASETTMTMSCELASMKLFSLITGSEVTTGEGTFLKRKVYEVSTAREFTLPETPDLVIGVGTLLEDNVSEDKSFEIITTGTDAVQGKALISGAVVKMYSSDLVAGDRLVVYYLQTLADGVQKFRVSAKPKAQYFEVYADISVKFDSDGSEDFVQLHIFKVKPQENLELTFDAENPSAFELSFDVLPDNLYPDSKGEASTFEWLQIIE